MSENFVMDWQLADEAKPCGSLVTIRMWGRKAGLYRVKEIMQEGILLFHGAISFPVGTRLEIDELQHLVQKTQGNLRVVANDSDGLSLAW